jgi:hypothetical protein
VTIRLQLLQASGAAAGGCGAAVLDGPAPDSGLAPAGCIGVTAAKIKRLKESSAEPNRLMRPIAHIVA